MLSKVEGGGCRVILMLATAGTVGVSALVKDTEEWRVLSLDGGIALGRRLLRVAEIPETLPSLLFEPSPRKSIEPAFPRPSRTVLLPGIFWREDSSY